MTRYATKECAHCHLLQPADQMWELQRRVATGGSTSSYTDRSGRRSGHRDTTHFSYQTYFLCEPCHAARFRRQVLVALLVAVGLVIAIFVAITGNRSHPSRQQAKPAAQPVNLLEGIDLESGGAVNAIEPSDAGETPTIQPPGDEATKDTPATVEPSDRIEALIYRIEEDVQAALDSGAARIWKRDGESGYVVPSVLQSGSDRKCRSFVVTLINGREQIQGDPVRRCFDEAARRWLP